MPNGHGGIPRFGLPIILLGAIVILVVLRNDTNWQFLRLVGLAFTVLLAWRLAFHLTMWDVSEYGGGYTPADQMSAARRKYLRALGILIILLPLLFIIVLW